MVWWRFGQAKDGTTPEEEAEGTTRTLSAPAIYVAVVRDGHTHWVMDIQPYPIQMFRVILDSSWVELNWVGYGYYPNCSGSVWILSKPGPLKRKNLSLSLTLSNEKPKQQQQQSQ